MTLMAKDAVYEGLKRLRAEGKRFFTIDQIREVMPPCVIRGAWLAMCLNKLGCTYDKSRKHWVDQRAIDADERYSPYLKAECESYKTDILAIEGMIRELHDFVEQFSNDECPLDTVLLYIQSKLDAILNAISDNPPKAPVKELPKMIPGSFKLKLAQDKVGEMVTALIHDDYCRGCKKTFFCKQYNLSSDAPASWLGVLPICKAHQDLIGEVAELDNILNEETSYE